MGAVERDRDRRSLQDLAKLAGSSGALTPGAPSVRPPAPTPGSGVAPVAQPSGIHAASNDAADRKEDSGLIDLKALTAQEEEKKAAAAAAALPAPAHHTAPVPPPAATTPGLGTANLFEESQAVRVAPVASAAVPSTGALPLPTATAKSEGGSNKGIFIGGGVVAALALAAGLVFVMRPKAEPVAPSAPLVTAPTDFAIAHRSPPKPAAAPVDEAPAAAAPAAEEKAADPSTLPAAKAAAKPAAPTAHEPAVAREAAPAAPKEPATAKKPEGKVDPKLVANIPSSDSAEPGSLSAAIKNSVGGGDEKKATPAAQDSTPVGNVPQKPSQGAVTGALGAVLPGARDCLGPDDPVSRATVVFASSGTVQSVSITGHAAGKPGEACIRKALLKAKVPPFAESSYSAPVTIRPN